jgi:Ca2+-binding EF-hand superfamily protein
MNASSLPSLMLAPLDPNERPTSAGSERDRDREASKKAAAAALEEEEREEKPLAEWAGEAGVPLDIAQQALDTFLEFVSSPGPPKYRVRKEAILFGRPFDAGVDLGSMDTAAFGQSCLRIADCKDFSALPDGFLEQAMKSCDKDGSGDIDFCEFLYFYYKFSFSEEVLIGPAERQIRCAARDNGIPYDEIGKYKSVFDQTDVNKNGRICYAEFRNLINKLLKIPKGEEMPERRLKDMWKEASRATAGKDLDFFAFVGWYKRYFMGEDSGYDNESPFEAYYHNIRRVSAYDSSLFH